MHLEIPTPTIFSFSHCLEFLQRTDLENTYFVKDESIWTTCEWKEQVYLFRLYVNPDNCLVGEFLDKIPDAAAREGIREYIREWLDLETPLEDFYQAMTRDKIVGPLVERYRGLRLVKVPDLFEAISWAIIGQQINLTFAYQVKKNLVEYCGNYLEYEGEKFYRFPGPEQVLALSDATMRQLKFSRQKSAYVKGVAEKILAGELQKDHLLQLPPREAREALIQIKGVGNWTANYVQMRCLHHRDAFPVEDVALHLALKNQFQLDRKPNKEQALELAKSWTDWKAYITYYLWATLRESAT